MPASPTASPLPAPQSAILPDWFTSLHLDVDYRLLEIIGSGGMGQVWRATTIDTGEDVAIKVIDPRKAADDHLLARLEAEAAALEKLRDLGGHPNIVPIRSFHLGEETGCLVMDYIPGQDIARWSDTHKLGLIQRVALMEKVSRAAGWCHEHAVVHRDLKPANLLVHSATGEPIIVDFSIAKLEEPLQLTLTNEALGTAPYMAPEQFDRAKGDPTPATDVYALGATLYELLTHIHPHPGDFAHIIHRHQNETPPARPSALDNTIPRDLESILLKALSPRPTDRYENGTALAEDLDRYLTGRPVQARPVSVLVYWQRQAQRRPSLSVAILICLCLLAALFWNHYRQSGERRLRDWEAQLVSAMQPSVWSAKELSRCDGTLGHLAQRDLSLADVWRQKVMEDITRDVESALQQSRLADADIAWMRHATAWLNPRTPTQAARLESLITARTSRWETLAELSAPFDDRHGFLKRGNYRVEGDLLFPIYKDDEKSYNPPNAISDALPLPVEAEFVLHVGTTLPRSLVVNANSKGISIEAWLVVAASAKEYIQKHGKPEAPDDYLLYLRLNKQMAEVTPIRRDQITAEEVRLVFRFERNRVEVVINGKWSTTVNSAFALQGAGQTANLRLYWPKAVGLKQLTLRTRQGDPGSPLDAADLLVAAGRHTEALRLYESQHGSPAFGAEADFKAAECKAALEDSEGADVLWNQLGQGPPSHWRDMANAQLWQKAVLLHGIAAAKPQLDRLPEPGEASAGIKAAMLSFDRRALSNAYARTGWGMSFLRTRIGDVEDAKKALTLLSASSLTMAGRLGGAYHFAGLDEAADALAYQGLRASDTGQLSDSDTRLAISVFDQWTRAKPSEKNPKLSERLKEWKAAYPNGPSIQALAHLEQARVRARARLYEKALPPLGFIRTFTSVEPRVLTTTGMVEGMVLDQLGRKEEARQVWLAGIQASRVDDSQNPLQLADRIFLHGLTRTWDAETCQEVLTQLIGKTKATGVAATMQATFLRTFLSDPSYAATLNAFSDSEEGRQIALDYAFCRQPLRTAGRRWMAKMLEDHAMVSAFPANASSAARSRVRTVMDAILHHIATYEGDVEPFTRGYLLAWAHPTLRSQWDDANIDAPSTLINQSRWLLAQRYLHLGKPEAAKPLLDTLQTHPTLPKDWHDSIHEQLKELPPAP